MDKFNAPWYTVERTGSVWMRTTTGDALVADCTSKVLPVSNQRLNARLISQAPRLYELLQQAMPMVSCDLADDILQTLQYVDSQG